MILILLACAGLGTAAAFPVQAPVVPAGGSPPIVQTRLALDLAIDYEGPTINGNATLTIENVGTGQVTAVPLLLNRLMRVVAVRDGERRPLVFVSTVDVFEDDPYKQVRRASVTLERPLAPGGRTTVSVDYRGPLVGYVETGSLYIKDRIDPTFTILRSDAFAFPVIGVPSGAANRAMPRRDFEFEARIDVPDTQVVATGGVQVERQVKGGRAAYRFSGKYVPFLNIAIAPYRLSGREGMRVYALPADADRADAILDAGRAAMALLQKWFGPLPASPNITVIEIPDGFGSQASATAGVLLDAAAFRDKAQLPQFYHELSHFWNAPDLDAPSLRWNEGLAMFLQYRLAREIDGFAGTSAALERARTRLCERASRAQIEATPFARFGVEGKTDYSYRVGFLMFSALERLVGPDVVDARLQEYLRAHITGGGTTQQLLDALAAPPLAPAVGPFLRDWFLTSAWLAPVCSAASFEEALGNWRRDPF